MREIGEVDTIVGSWCIGNSRMGFGAGVLVYLYSRVTGSLFC